MKELEREAEKNDKATRKSVEERKKAMQEAYKTDDDATVEAVDKKYIKEYEELRVKKEEINEAQSKTNELIKKATEELEHQKRLKEAGSQLDYEVEKYDFASEISDRKELNELLRETSERMGLIENAAARVALKTGEEKSEILATNKEYRELKHTFDTLNDIKGEINRDKMFSGVGNGLETAINGFKGKLKGLFDEIPGSSKFKGKLNSIFKVPGVDKFSRDIKNAFDKGGKSTKGFGNNIKRHVSGALKNIKKVATGVFGNIGKLADKAGNRIKTAFLSGAKSILKMSGAIFAARSAYSLLKNVVSNYLSENEALQNQINGLTSAFGEMLGPAINFVTSAFSKAISYISAFTNALFGINLVAKANKKSLEGQSAAAEELKRSTAGFDEITKLGSAENNSSTGGSSSGSAAFSEVEMPNWGQKIIDSIKNGDWAGAATTLTDKLNSLVDGVEWTTFGTKIGEHFSNALTFLDTAINNFDWQNLGGTLGEGVNSLGNAIDWSAAGKTLSDGIIGVLNSITAFLETTDWQQIGSNIATFIGSIDFGGVISALSEGIGAALGGIAQFIWGLLEDAWDDVIDWWHENAYEDGEFTIQGLLDGISEKLIDIKTWIDENISQPFIEGVKKAFGIDDSSSEEMKILGDSLTKGLLSGVLDRFGPIGSWIKFFLFNPFMNGFKNAFEIHSPSKVMEEQGGCIMDGLFNGITEKIEKIKTAATDIKEAILAVFNNFGAKLKEKFSEAWKKVKDVFSEKGKIFDGIKEGISETFKSIVNKLIDGINKIVTTPFNAINRMLNRVRDIKVLGVQPFVNLWDYNPLAVPQIPQLKLAKGAIVNNPGRGVVTAITGEDGREAVLPLDKNTSWIDELAERLSSKIGVHESQIVIPIYLDGKIIAKYIVDLKNRKAFITNGRVTT